MTAAPPLDAADQRAMAVRLPPIAPGDAVLMPGALGTVAGARTVTAVDDDDAAPVSTALTAATRNVYAVPLVKPVTVVEVLLPATETVRTTVVPLIACTV